MTNHHDPVGQLADTYDHTVRVFGQITEDQRHVPTPCTEWDLHQLVEHTIGSVDHITSALGGTPPSHEGDSSPAEAMRASADASLAAWRSPGALEGMVDLGPATFPAQVAIGINQLDTLTHSWDVAEAIGADRSIDPELAASTLATCREVVTDEVRGEPFGPEIAVGPDAPVHDQLAAFLGRTPS